MEEDNRLKVLLIKDSGPWVVLCLDYDIAAQGETVETAWESFNWSFWTQVLIDRQKGIKPLSQLKRSPEEYWKRFSTASPYAKRFELTPPFSLDEIPSVTEDIRLAAA